jgi:hypothetical protein
VLASWLLLACIAAVPATQDQPDFSGRWVLADPPPATGDIARTLVARQTRATTTMRGEPMAPWWSELIVEREFPDGVRTEVHKIGIAGGTVAGGVLRQPGERGPAERTTFEVSWRGQDLLIQSARHAAGSSGSAPTDSHTESWSLDDKGLLVITTTDGHSGAAPVTRTLTYRRQGP